MNWWPVYGTFVSVMSIGAVLIMARTVRTMRKACDNMHRVVFNMTMATSNMWDTLTPEQIRTLHPGTVEMGNAVPPWDEIRKATNVDG